MQNILNSLMSGGYDPFDGVAECEEHDSNERLDEEPNVEPCKDCTPYQGVVDMDELPF